MKEQQMSKIADAAMLAGTLILENGGETYRAEETAYHVCRAGGVENPEIIALPTGIFVTGNQGRKGEQHGFMRVHQSAVHLYKLERTNRYCREYIRGECDIDQLYDRLCQLRTSTVRLTILRQLIISSLITASFALMLGGGVHDMWIALICGLVLKLATLPFEGSTNSTVTVNLIGGASIALTAVLFTHFAGLGTADIVIVASIMPLLPGLATLNAIRDAMCGDLVSGSARLLKAMLIALSLAGGVGLVLAVYVMLGGMI